MQHGDKKDAESRTRGGKSTMGLNKKMTKGTLGNESAEEEEEAQIHEMEISHRSDSRT